MLKNSKKNLQFAAPYSKITQYDTTTNDAGGGRASDLALDTGNFCRGCPVYKPGGNVILQMELLFE